VIKSKAPAPIWDQLIGAAENSGHAEKTALIIQQSPDHAAQRVPAPSGCVLNLSEPVSLFIDFAVKRDSIGYEAVEYVAGHSRVFFAFLFSALTPAHLLCRSRDATALHPKS
jgi:hypothetical protein